jgi:hypothetical protein
MTISSAAGTPLPDTSPIAMHNCSSPKEQKS